MNLLLQAIFKFCTTERLYKTFFKKLSILQNKFVKIIGGGSYYDRATSFYAKLGILKLADSVKFEKALFVFKFKMKTLPAQFSKYFCEVSSVRKRSTRASTQNHYFMRFLKKSKLQNSIRDQGPLFWNSLDSTIKNSKSIKSNLKRTLLEKYSLVQFSSIKASITYIP